MEFSTTNNNGVKHVVVSTPRETNSRVTITRMSYHPVTIIKYVEANIGYSNAMQTIANFTNLDDDIFALLAESTKE